MQARGRGCVRRCLDRGSVRSVLGPEWCAPVGLGCGPVGQDDIEDARGTPKGCDLADVHQI